ncbi:MAG: hypothetical protein U5L11_03690 [Arhodomonas sp.]|nr:hypothetical protein [Arhodomonas sp.]
MGRVRSDPGQVVAEPGDDAARLGGVPGPVDGGLYRAGDALALSRLAVPGGGGLGAIPGLLRAAGPCRRQHHRPRDLGADQRGRGDGDLYQPQSLQRLHDPHGPHGHPGLVAARRYPGSGGCPR